MRVGLNPSRKQKTGHKPSRVTVCVLVSIPHQTGYYANRFEVVKLCLQSIKAHTDRNAYDLLVFDNGSCAEVVDYLLGLHQQDDIQYLFCSRTNIGMANAYRMMFHSAPGEIIAYSDDDVFFYPGWLTSLCELLENFPRVGMVSGLPVREQFRYGNRYLEQYLSSFPDIVARRGRFIPPEWDAEFLASTGRRKEELPDATNQLEEIMIERGQLRAISTAVHFQFVAFKQTLVRVINEEWEPRLIEGDKEMDERMDALGFARLSTVDKNVEHIGNVISFELAARIATLGTMTSPPPWSPPPQFLLRLSRAKIARRVLAKLNTWSYFLLHYRRLID
jgi:hypothetical protein